MTVGFNQETAHCFRCQWKSGRTTLAKQLGIISDQNTTPEERVAALRDARAERFARSLRRFFDAWRDRQERSRRDQYYLLGRAAAIASRVLVACPDDELCWDALATFYHAEASLSAEIELLCGAKVPQYAETTGAEQLVEEWRTAR